MDELLSNKPQRLIEEAPPEIRNYILLLEEKLTRLVPFEDHYNEVNDKYVNVQEDLFALQINTNEFKYKIKELTQENDKLSKENERLNKENGKTNKLNIVSPKNLQISRYIKQTAKGQHSIEATDPDQNSANCILLKGVPNELFGASPTLGVIHLGRLLNLQLTEVDIRKITNKERKFYERQNMKPDKLIFIVELSNSDTKVNILKNKEKLKLHPNAKDIEITDFVSEDVYNLYQYAKVLKSCGYHLVYWRNNSVYAKKTRSSNSQPILIESASQVDVLKEIK